MGFIYAGGEDIDVENGNINGVYTCTAAGFYRSGIARCAICAKSFNTVNTVNCDYPTIAGAGFSTGWASCQAWGSPAAAGQPIFGLCMKDSGGNVICWYVIGTDTGSATKLALYQGTGNNFSTANKLASETGNSFTALSKLDIQFGSLTTGSAQSAAITIFCNRTQIIYVTGQLGLPTSGSVAMVNCLKIGTIVAAPSASSGGISELILTPEDTRTMSVYTQYPAANGAFGAWNFFSFSNVNQVVTGATPDWSGQSGQALSYQTQGGLPTTANFTLYGFRVAVRASCASAALHQIQVGYYSPSASASNLSPAEDVTATITADGIYNAGGTGSGIATPADMNQVQIYMKSA